MTSPSNERHNIDPGLAAVFSFIFSGLGQIYNGQISKGLCIMLLSSIGMVLLIVGAIQIWFSIMPNIMGEGGLITGSVLFLIGLTLIAVLGLYNIYDAYNTAKKKSERQ